MSPAVLLGLAISGLSLAAFAAIGTRVLQQFHRHELEEFCRTRGRVDVFERVMDSHDRLTLAAESLQVTGTMVLTLAGSLYLFGEPNQIQRFSTKRNQTTLRFDFMQMLPVLEQKRVGLRHMKANPVFVPP